MKRPQILTINGLRDRRSSRRTLLQQMASLSLGFPLSQSNAFPLLAEIATPSQKTQPHDRPAPPPAPTSLSPEDEQFLDDLQHSSFLFFWEQG